MHGRHDMTIPVSHGRRLHELAPHSRYVELDCGHSDFRSDWNAIAAFLRDNGFLP
jgi:pimeloyl-ACP methyl ester carboxylesterase